MERCAVALCATSRKASRWSSCAFNLPKHCEIISDNFSGSWLETSQFPAKSFPVPNQDKAASLQARRPFSLAESQSTGISMVNKVAPQSVKCAIV
ncbi:hypothetical protein RHIZ404_210605 [Rhizobium sp. EC-SD404]|nr:hypothetical protein RHIZ404_210605 [Rhizobium sp. EC-SD404]